MDLFKKAEKHFQPFNHNHKPFTCEICLQAGPGQRWVKPGVGVGLESEYGVFCRIRIGVGVPFLVICWSRSAFFGNLLESESPIKL